MDRQADHGSHPSAASLNALSPHFVMVSPFTDPDPFHQLTFPSVLEAKRAIADHLGMPLARLSPERLAALNTLLAATLAKKTVWDHVRHHLDPFYRG